METKTYCKRCNRELKNPESIKLGYGKKCFILSQFENKDNCNSEILNTLNFLKCEINMIKLQMKQLKQNGNNGNSKVEAIERIKREVVKKDDKFVNNMNSVIAEMKELFVSVKDVKDLLIHIELN